MALTYYLLFFLIQTLFCVQFKELDKLEELFLEITDIDLSGDGRTLLITDSDADQIQLYENKDQQLTKLQLLKSNITDETLFSEISKNSEWIAIGNSFITIYKKNKMTKLYE